MKVLLEEKYGSDDNFDIINPDKEMRKFEKKLLHI
jgi:hypothetical protein